MTDVYAAPSRRLRAPSHDLRGSWHTAAIPDACVCDGPRACREGLARCAELRTLYLTGCALLEDVTPLAACAALHTLHLGRCRGVRDVGLLGRCTTLRVLNLRCSGAVVVPRREGLLIEWDVSGSNTIA